MRSQLTLAILLLVVSGSSYPQSPSPSGEAAGTQTPAVSPVLAQTAHRTPRTPLRIKYTSHETNAVSVNDTSLYKRKGQWQRIVDESWGPGLLRYQKQIVFDTYANYIQAMFACFGGLDVRWDSLRALYSSQITDATSRGGFSSILSRLAHDLRDLHAMALEKARLDVDTALAAVESARAAQMVRRRELESAEAALSQGLRPQGDGQCCVEVRAPVSGRVLRVLTDRDRALVEKVNLVRRHKKADQASQGGIVDKESALHLSNLAPVCEECDGPARVGFKVLDDGVKVRTCKGCGESLDK